MKSMGGPDLGGCGFSAGVDLYRQISQAGNANNHVQYAGYAGIFHQ